MIDRTASTSRPPPTETPETPGERDAAAVAAAHEPRRPMQAAAATRRADESLRMFAANQSGVSAASGGAAAPSRRDDVLYLGMNMVRSETGRPQADLEAAAVARMTNGHAQRIARVSTAVVESAGAKFDLGHEGDCRGFARTLGLGAAQTAIVARALVDNPEGAGRTELALLAKHWSEAEHGRATPGRLVLSGHCTGLGVYDDADPDARLSFDSIRALAHAMPKASAQVEDVLISACNSGFEGVAEVWAEAFPNLKSLWAYGSDKDAHSPTGATAVQHIRVWEEATRSDRLPQDPANAARIHALPMHDHVSTWTARDGYRNSM